MLSKQIFLMHSFKNRHKASANVIINNIVGKMFVNCCTALYKSCFQAINNDNADLSRWQSRPFFMSFALIFTKIRFALPDLAGRKNKKSWAPGATLPIPHITFSSRRPYERPSGLISLIIQEQLTFSPLSAKSRSALKAPTRLPYVCSSSAFPSHIRLLDPSLPPSSRKRFCHRPERIYLNCGWL